MDSPLWSLVYIALTWVMMVFAYYSRAESIQKIGFYIFITNLITHAVFDTEYRLVAFLTIDLVGFVYAGWLAHKCDCRAGAYVATLFAAMVFSHNWADLGLIHIIAGNMLYVAQLAILCIYGQKYGREARCNPADKNRNDPFYRITMAFVPWLKN